MARHRGQKVQGVVCAGDPRRRTGVGTDGLCVSLAVTFVTLIALLAGRWVPSSSPATGGRARLGDVADVDFAPTPNEIKREGASRRIDVTCNVAGRDLGSVAREIGGKVRAIPFPRGTHPELLGEFAAREQAGRRLLLLSVVAVLGIFALLQADFQSVRLTLLVGLTLPFALTGGVFAAFFTAGVLSIGSLVGFVTVLGIAARNGIMLVSHCKHLREVEGEPAGAALFLRGAGERLAPILMTASCAGLALMPLIAKGNIPGQEIEYPMAVVILGGLATSTLLNLLLLPALIAKWGGRDRERSGRE